MTAKFHVGQRVRAIDIDHPDYEATDVLEGVIAADADESYPLINFGARFEGHNGPTGEDGTCWYVHVDHLKAIDEVIAPKVDPKRAGQQTDRILAHLVSGKSITQLEAFGVYRIFRLAARIHELKQKGHKIVTTMRQDATGKPYAEYELVTRRLRHG
jgi:hypothetical protein